MQNCYEYAFLQSKVSYKLYGFLWLCNNQAARPTALYNNTEAENFNGASVHKCRAEVDYSFWHFEDYLYNVQTANNNIFE